MSATCPAHLNLAEFTILIVFIMSKLLTKQLTVSILTFLEKELLKQITYLQKKYHQMKCQVPTL
jgi:hypothetical protein